MPTAVAYSSNESDPFYVFVLQAAIRDGIFHASDRVLVVCGGAKDEASLHEAGLKNFSVSNISGDSVVDVENLSYGDGAFDVVIVHSGLHHCASPHRGLLEMYRVASKALVLFEPADNFVTRLGQHLRFGQTYEFAAVADNQLACAGWRNTSIPNWVYRFTAQEIRQTINCAAPFGPHAFHFFYRTRIPWRQLKARRNKLPLLLAAAALPVLRLLDMLGPWSSNNLAAAIKKPALPGEMFSWLQQGDSGPEANRDWFHKNYQI